MQTNITTTKTPSLVQPQQRTREQWFKYMDELVSQGMEDIAKEMDRLHKIGYFAEKDHPEIKWLNEFITQNAEMLALKEKVKRLVHEKDTVLIYGESGTGKELLAKALHGNKSPETFIGINCAGLPEALIEAELFGYEEGSFTGGKKGGKAGLFQEAKDGTLFLDEIGELPLAVQAKLLRVMQERQVRRVGATNLEPIQCRFMCATHQRLPDSIKSGFFRLDLYYRISTIILKTTPLRDRPEDIPLIVAELEKDNNLQPFPKDYDWNKLIVKTDLLGNVRELQQIIRRYQLFRELPS